MTAREMPDEVLISDAVEYLAPPDFTWTENTSSEPLPHTSIPDLVSAVEDSLTRKNVIFPDQRRLIGRCVSALLVGHLVLQGPPGTGKSTLAVSLADAFDAVPEITTATSDWSTFHVVGGLKPDAHGGLTPQLGAVPRAALSCAERVRDDLNARAAGRETGEIATWLLIDEFNRADVDKAIGSLYTLLGSTDPDHVTKSPLELWFHDDDEARYLWVPARFRIIGTMNDLDTNFVSPMSQGLRRRFQFVTVGVPTEGGTSTEPISEEVEQAFLNAAGWLSSTYAAHPRVDRSDLEDSLRCLQRVLDGLRRPTAPAVMGWPVGTAQAVDVLKVVLLADDPSDRPALDLAIADRLIAQMNMISKGQYEEFSQLLETERLEESLREFKHLYRPYST